MADVNYKAAPFGDYADGSSGAVIKANIEKLIALLTPSSESAPKLMANPEFALPDAEVCRLVVAELEAIKAKVTVA